MPLSTSDEKGISESTPELSWRLVYHDGNILQFFESSGVTKTIRSLFYGTKEECIAHAQSLELTIPEKFQSLFQ